MLGHPAGVVDVVEAVRSADTGAKVLVADPALGYFPAMTLELVGGDVVVAGDPGRHSAWGLPWQDSQAMRRASR